MKLKEILESLQAAVERLMKPRERVMIPIKVKAKRESSPFR